MTYASIISGDSVCHDNYWQCPISKECISINFICNGIKNCKHNEDEYEELCSKLNDNINILKIYFFPEYKGISPYASLI